MPEEFTFDALWAEYSPYILTFGLKVLGALFVLIDDEGECKA